LATVCREFREAASEKMAIPKMAQQVCGEPVETARCQLPPPPSFRYFQFSMSCLFLLIVALLYSVANAECTESEYKAKFGALPTYVMQTFNGNPAVEDGFLIADVSYKSYCQKGGSAFTGTFVHREENGKIVLFLKRLPALCKPAEKLTELQEWRGTIGVPLDAKELENFIEQTYAFIAFPPDGQYEIYHVKQRESTHDGTQARNEYMSHAAEYEALAEIAESAANANANANASTNAQAHMPARVPMPTSNFDHDKGSCADGQCGAGAGAGVGAAAVDARS